MTYNRFNLGLGAAVLLVLIFVGSSVAKSNICFITLNHFSTGADSNLRLINRCADSFQLPHYQISDEYGRILVNILQKKTPHMTSAIPAPYNTSFYKLFFGEFAENNGLTDDAFAWYETVSVVDPGYLNGWIKLGEFYAKIGKSEEEINAYEKAIAIDFETGADYLANAYIRAGEFEKADHLYREVIQAFPQSPNLLLWYRRWCLGAAGREAWETAWEACNAGITIFPENESFYAGLALAEFYYKEDFNRSKEIIEEAIEKYPDNGELYFTAATLLMAEEKYEEADLLLIKAIRFNPSNSRYQLIRANLARDRRDFQLAHTLYKTYLQENPDMAHGHYHFARFHFLSNDIDAAIDEMEIAIELGPAPAFFYYELGTMYELTTNNKAAFAAYEKALSINPNHKLAIERLTALQSLE